MRKSDALALFEKTLGGHPVALREFGLTMNFGATEKQITLSIRQLLNSEQAVTVRARFMMGDLYNQIHKQKGLRKWLAEMVATEFGEKTYQMLRTYGWVANKWPEEARSDQRGWTYYLRNKNGQEPRAENDNETVLEVARIDRNMATSVFHCVTKTGRRFVLHIADDWIGAQDARVGSPLYEGLRTSGASITNDEREDYAA